MNGIDSSLTVTVCIAPLLKGALGALLVTYTTVLLLPIFFIVEVLRRWDWGIIRAP